MAFRPIPRFVMRAGLRKTIDKIRLASVAATTCSFVTSAIYVAKYVRRRRTPNRNPHHESSGKRPSFPLSSNDDDRDHRTRAEVTKAKRRGRAHHCGLRRRDLPDTATARDRLPRRLAVVFLDRLSAGFFDQHRRQSHGVFRRFDGDRRHPLAERIAPGAFCPTAAATTRRLRVATPAPCAADRFLHADTRSTAAAAGYRGRRSCACSTRPRGRSRQLGRLPPVSL